MEWYEIENTDDILTPALAFYPDRILHNIDMMIKIAGDPARLRPHVKTYKMPQIVKMQMDRGINKFKCSTLAEMHMLIEADVQDILLAMPLIGPAQKVFLKICREHPDLQLTTLIDHDSQIEAWVNLLDENESLNLYLDVDVGMHRTGISPDHALGMINKINSFDQLKLKGLHLYDGHIRSSKPEERTSECNQGMGKVLSIVDKIKGSNLDLVCGGSVTFPVHAQHHERTLSPGTTLLWDYRYGSSFPDIPIQWAAVLLARIISMPDHNRICIDLGHKAVASEMQDRRVFFPQLGAYSRVGHSEEHLVLELADRSGWNVGDVLYGIPTHICPTVALHREALIIEDHAITDRWEVAARHRIYLTENV